MAILIVCKSVENGQEEQRYILPAYSDAVENILKTISADCYEEQCRKNGEPNSVTVESGRAMAFVKNRKTGDSWLWRYFVL